MGHDRDGAVEPGVIAAGSGGAFDRGLVSNLTSAKLTFYPMARPAPSFRAIHTAKQSFG